MHLDNDRLSQFPRLKHPLQAPVRKAEDAARAKWRSASSLLDGTYVPPEGSIVSPLIHQSWKNSEIAPKLQGFVDSWRTTYPDFEIILWTNDDNEALVRKKYPQLLDAYLALPADIFRADFTRNLYMHAFGGIYSDLDAESYKNLLPIFTDAISKSTASKSSPPPKNYAFLGEMDTRELPERVGHSVPNAFMASQAPGHDFWMNPVNHALNVTEERAGVSPEWITGPVALRETFLTYPASHLGHPSYQILTPPSPKSASEASALLDAANQDPVLLLPPPLIYPYSWTNQDPLVSCVCSAQFSTFNGPACNVLAPGGAVASYWGHSWAPKSFLSRIRGRKAD